MEEFISTISKEVNILGSVSASSSPNSWRLFLFLEKKWIRKKIIIMDLDENLYEAPEANFWVENILEVDQEWKKGKWKDPWVKTSLEAPRVGKHVENLLWGNLCVFPKKRKKRKEKNKMPWKGPQTCSLIKFCVFCMFLKATKDLEFKGQQSMHHTHSSSIHFTSSMPTMSRSSILTSRHPKPIFKQFSSFYRVSCSYYRKIL